MKGVGVPGRFLDGDATVGELLEVPPKPTSDVPVALPYDGERNANRPTDVVADRVWHVPPSVNHVETLPRPTDTAVADHMLLAVVSSSSAIDAVVL